MSIVIDLYRNNNKAVIDAFDRIVVNIFMEKEKCRHKSFLICGCDAGAGTTSISVELAISMAVSGWKTVLVDADLRKEGKYKRLNQKAEAGLSDYIIHENLDKSIIYHTNWSGLDYIACGKEEGETPVKMLCSHRMGELVERLNKEYDFVIFDVPSLNSSVDAKIMSSKVDCTYLVAAAEQTTFENLSSARDQLVEVGANVAGVIVNKVSFDEYGQYVKDYNYFNQKEYISRNKYYNEENNKGKKKKSSVVSFMKKLMGCFLLICFLAAGISTENVFASTNSTSESDQGMLPVIIATGYSILDGTSAAGSSFTLGIQIKNVNRYVGAYQMYITVNFKTDGVYLQQGETNQRYLEYLAPSGTADFQVNVAISDQVQSDSGIVEIRFDYVNEYGKVGTNTTTISPKIKKSCKLEILSMTAAKSATLGSKALFNIRYQNSGETDIKNLKMRIKGSIETDDKEIALEAPETGRQKYLDQYIVFTETGNQSLNVYVSYEDEEGNLYQLEPRKVSVLVTKSSEGLQRNSDSPQMVERQQSVFGKLLEKPEFIYICIAAVICVILFFLIRLIIKRGVSLVSLRYKEEYKDSRKPEESKDKRKKKNWCFVSLRTKKK